MSTVTLDRRLVFPTYIQMIKNSVGSKMFSSSFGLVKNKKTDLTKKGVLSCAYFASSVLKIHKLIEGVHLTVDGTERDLANFGWRETSTPKKGSVLVWKNKKYSTGVHRHIGFYINKNTVISNNSLSKKIEKERFNQHLIEKIYYFPNIEKS